MVDASELELLDGLSEGYRIGGGFLRLALDADMGAALDVDLEVDLDADLDAGWDGGSFAFVFVLGAPLVFPLDLRGTAGGLYHDSSSPDPLLVPPLDPGPSNTTDFFFPFFFSFAFFSNRYASHRYASRWLSN